MRYDTAGRFSRFGQWWLRLRLRMPSCDWLRPTILPDLSHLTDYNDLPDHLRRDIGLPEPLQHMDWKAIRDKGLL
jgi:hypothetical protein